VIIVGFGMASRLLARTLKELGRRYIVLELDPDRVRAAEELGEPVYYADATSPEALGHAHLEDACAIAVLTSDTEAVHLIVAAVREQAPKVPIFLRTRYWRDRRRLLKRYGSEPDAAPIEVVAEEMEGGAVVTDQVLGLLGIEADESLRRIAEARDNLSTR
jgi:CPA2 family monovalent cation:H+ antiporter-2